MYTLTRKQLAATALLAFAAAAATNPAHAKTATNLICSGCVGAKDLGTGAVTAKKLKAKAVKAKHLHKSAKPAGVGSASSQDPIALTGSHATVLSVSVTAPGPGFFVTSADFTVDYPGGGAVFGCDISSGTVDGLNDLWGQGTGLVPASLTRVVAVDSAGEATINLICTEGGGDVEIDNVNFTAVFVPGSY